MNWIDLFYLFFQDREEKCPTPSVKTLLFHHHLPFFYSHFRHIPHHTVSQPHLLCFPSFSHHRCSKTITVVSPSSILTICPNNSVFSLLSYQWSCKYFPAFLLISSSRSIFVSEIFIIHLRFFFFFFSPPFCVSFCLLPISQPEFLPHTEAVVWYKVSCFLWFSLLFLSQYHTRNVTQFCHSFFYSFSDINFPLFFFSS